MTEGNTDNAMLNMSPEEVDNLIGITKRTIGEHVARKVRSSWRHEEPPDVDIAVLCVADQLIAALEGQTFEEATYWPHEYIEDATDRWMRILNEQANRDARYFFMTQEPRSIADLISQAYPLLGREITGAELVEILRRDAGDPERAKVAGHYHVSDEDIAMWLLYHG